MQEPKTRSTPQLQDIAHTENEAIIREVAD